MTSMRVRYSDDPGAPAGNGHQTGGGPRRNRSRSRSGPGPQDHSDMYAAVSLSDQGYGAALPSYGSHALMSPSTVHPVPGPVAHPQSLVERRDHEQRTVIKLANAEIDELKDGLRYAE